MDLHDLTAAYALDALGPEEAEAYERHLGQCEECREQLAELNEATNALAFGAVAPEPPASLRASILEQAAAERTNVVPLLRRPWVSRGLAVAAAAAACVVVGVVVSSMQKPGSVVSVAVISRNGSAMLHVSGLSRAPQGKTYEAWIIPAGGSPRPAGLFAGGAAETLALPTLPRGATVAITVEPARGTTKPTTTPIFATQT